MNPNNNINVKENIEVCVRIKPKLNNKEEEINFNIGNNSIELLTKNNTKLKENKEYLFTNIYDDNASNLEIYEKSVKSVAMGLLDGINGSIFWYGQTGSGKTYTMVGYNPKTHKKKIRKLLSTQNSFVNSPLKREKILKNFNMNREKSISNINVPSNEGILQISIKDILLNASNDNDNYYEISCNYFEIYNDNIYDLFDNNLFEMTTNNLNKSIKPLKVKENTKNHEFYIAGLISETLKNYEEFIKIFDNGEKNRHISSTNFNFQSSRSHTIFKMIIKKTNKKTNSTINSHINFIDLAGSEKIKEFSHEKSNEGKHINKSLFFLTRIISLKSSDEKIAHMPYRNSPLTKLTKNSIGGNARTKIILCLSPYVSSFENNIFTLNFGLMAKKITNDIQANIEYDKLSKSDISNFDYVKKLNDLKRQNSTLKKNYELFFDKKFIVQEKKELKKPKSIILKNCGIIKSHTFISNTIKKDLIDEIDKNMQGQLKSFKEKYREEKKLNEEKINDLNKKLLETQEIADMILKGKIPEKMNDEELSSFEINCLILLENIKIKKAKNLILNKNPEFKDYLDENMPYKKVPIKDEHNIDYIKDYQLIGLDNDTNIEIDSSNGICQNDKDNQCIPIDTEINEKVNLDNGDLILNN